MSAVQMVTHLDGAFRMATRELPVLECRFPLASLVRFAVLRSGMPWRKNFQTIPELDFSRLLVPTDGFYAIRDSLIGRIDAFPSLAPEQLLRAHPMLGPMSHWEWMRWGYLHTDHHLRQFDF